jgi:hypothetical protein
MKALANPHRHRYARISTRSVCGATCSLRVRGRVRVRVWVRVRVRVRVRVMVRVRVGFTTCRCGTGEERLHRARHEPIGHPPQAQAHIYTSTVCAGPVMYR